MNLKPLFTVFQHLSVVRMLNIVIIVSLLLASCGQPATPAHDEPIEPTSQVQKNEPYQAENNYTPPVFTQPKPVIVNRPEETSVPEIEKSPTLIIQDEESEQLDEIVDQTPEPNNIQDYQVTPISLTPIPQIATQTAEKTPERPSNEGRKQAASTSQTETMDGATDTDTIILGSEVWSLNGGAIKSPTSEAVILTDETSNILEGSAWFPVPISLDTDFELTFELYLGKNSVAPFYGADGMTFALQGVGPHALGHSGGGLGYEGISPSIAVEFDTYKNTEHYDPGYLSPGYAYHSFDSSHIALVKNGNVNHAQLPLVDTPTPLEDMKEHTFRVQWIAAEHTLIISSPNASGEDTIWFTHTEDFSQTAFGGNPQVWFGFTGAVASGKNLQYFDNVTTSSAQIQGLYSSLGACNISCQETTQNSHGGPINSRTGGYDYFSTDISVPSSAGSISFERTYSSLATALYTDHLGYGWTHNHDMSLTIGEYDSETNTRLVIVKGETGNQYSFSQINGDSILTPTNGIHASLVEGSSSFVLTDKAQNEYTFDGITGKLLSFTGSNGQSILYSYDVGERLTTISDETGQRYLELGYSGNETRISTVTDYANRTITFTYDANGDLISATDLNGNLWTYTYDDWHRVIQVTDPAGRIIERTEYEANTADARAVRQYDGENNLVVELTYNSDGTTTITDALGHMSLDQYDYRNTFGGEVDPTGGQSFRTYDSNFRPSTITDAGGDTTVLSWSADGANLMQVIDAEGGQTDIAYDSLNNPTSVIDPLGYLTTYEYDGTLLTNTTNALNQETTYTYTPEWFLESVTDPLGNTTSYTYDSHGQRTSMTDSLENTWTYTYDPLGRLTDTTDPLGRVTHNEYDAVGRLLRSVRNYDPNKSQNENNLWNIVTEYEYDLSGNQTLVRDSYGRETEYQYDNAGRLVTTIDPAGNQTTSTYNTAGQLVSTTDGLGRVTTYAYDAAGRLVSTTDALGNATSTAYNPDGTVASTTDALGTTTYTYDDLKRVLTVTQPNGAVTTNTYDDNGNVVTTTDALGNTTHYEYDALGRVIKTTDPIGNYTENFYDDAGRLVQTRDARGNATTFGYDNAGRQISVTDALGNATSYEYDTLGRRIVVIDAAGNRTEYTYDALDRVIAVTDPLGNVVTTNYDALGQVTKRTDANGNDVTFVYNDLGQTTSQIDTLGNITSFEYDAAGNRTGTTDPRGSVVTITYDDLNRPVASIDPLGVSTTTTYNEAGMVTASTNGNGESTTFSYNSTGQQTAVTDAMGNTTQYTYDLTGRVTRTTDANGNVTAYEYDSLGRLTAVIENYQAGVQSDAQTNVRTEYTYDENSNRLTIKDGNGNITTFVYDALNRLVSETDPLGNTWSYAYNELGQRVSMTDANGVTTLYEFDESSRLSTINYEGPDDVSFTYDNAGRRLNMTDSMGTTEWSYDPLNRITAITDPFGDTVSYTYDAAGNKTSIIYPDSQSVSYAYDSANRLNTVTDATGDVTYQYDSANRLVGVTRPGGINTVYAYDSAGRLNSIQHTAGEEVLSSFAYTYDANGNRTQAVEYMNNMPSSFANDMENGTGAWESTGDWTVVDNVFYSSTHSWSLNPGDGFQSGTDTNLTMNSSILLPTNTERPELSFNSWSSAASDSAFTVEISTNNGQTWDVLKTYTSADNRISWAHVRLPLDAYKGQLIRIRFHAIQGDSQISDQWFLDDFRIGERENYVPLEYPFSDDLEENTARWETTGQWMREEGDAYNSSFAFDLNPSSVAQSNSDSSLELVQPIIIPAEAEHPELTWYDHFEVSDDTVLSVEVTADNGLSWTALNTYSSAYNRTIPATGSAQVWILRRIGLDAYKGQAIRVRFRAVQGDSTTADSWKIDTIAIGDHPTLQTHSYPAYFEYEYGVEFEPNGQWMAISDWYDGLCFPECYVWWLNPAAAAQSNTDFTLEVTPQVEIPIDAEQPAISWYDRLNIAPDTTLSVDASTDGGSSWTTIGSLTSADNNSQWKERSIRLDTYKGQNIRVRFRALQGDSDFVDEWLLGSIYFDQYIEPDEVSYTDDMESGAGLWNATGGWAQVDTNANSPSHSWSLNPADSYQQNTDYSLELTQSIAIPSDIERPELTYSTWLYSASDSAFTLEVSTDEGQTWSVLKSYPSSNNRQSWNLQRVALDDYKGQSIRIRFHAMQNTSWTKDQWVVDDVRIGAREPVPALAYPFNDDLENGMGNWEVTGQWAVAGSDLHGGASALNLNPANEYQQSTDFTAELTGQVTIPADATRPELTWYDHLVIGSDTTLKVEATTDDGATWTTIQTFTSAYNRPDWALRRIALDTYKGQTIRIRFRAIQGTSWTKDIWVLDDIALSDRTTSLAGTYPFVEGFEAGAGNWEVGGQWAAANLETHTGNASLDMNPADGYQQNTEFSAELTAQITIPADAVRPELSWYDHLNIGSDTSLKVEASIDDGLTWTTIATFTSAHNRPDWILRAVALDAYKGQTLRIRFRAIQGSSWTKDIWRLDDLTIGEHQVGVQGNYPYQTDLESGADGWQVSGQWALTESEAHSVSHAWSLNPSNGYQQNTDFSLTMTTNVAIPADAARPELTWFDHLTIGSDTTLKVEASTDDGVTWTTIRTLTSAYNRPDWAQRFISLDAYKGQTIRLRFRALQGSSWTKDIWLLDDLFIGEHAASASLPYPFEEQNTDLQITDSWLPDGQWSAISDSGFDDGFALSLNPANAYQQNTDFSLELNGQITIPADAARPELTWDDLLTIGSDTTLKVEASTDDGVTWTTIRTLTSAFNRTDPSTGSGQAWIERSVSLDAFKGQTIRLRFRAVQGSSWTKDVWNLDNIRIADRETRSIAFPFEDLITAPLITDSWLPDGQWAVTNTDGYNDSFSFSLNPANGYQQGTNFALALNGNISLPADATELKLSYYDKFTLASDTTAYLEISTDDSLTWTPLSTFKATNNTTTWTLREVDLSAYAGQSVSFRFRAVQGNSWTKDIWLVDDVNLSGTLAPTPIPTETLTPTPLPEGEGTATPTDLPTETPTPDTGTLDTPTPTEASQGYQPSSVQMVSFNINADKSSGFKANAAPAIYSSLTVDEFDSETLASAWEWNTPEAGPTWSLTENPGFFQFTVPAGYEHWVGINSAPTLRRVDMGSSDFAIETQLDISNPPDGFYQFGLMVGFSETDRLWLGVNPGNVLNLERTGVDYFDIGLAMMPVFIRIEKNGTEYTFLYKQDVNETWISLATYTVSEPVKYVGFQGRTPSAESDLVVAVDYFRLERTNSIGNGEWTPPTPLPTIAVDASVTIDYTYDALNRLTNADYSNGYLYQYTYDAVGNRLTASNQLSPTETASVTSYQYDIANHLINMNGVDYTWDANGNLLNDGTNAYTYDYVNRLSSVTSEQSSVTSYTYNGLGDRLSQSVNGVTTNYTLDLNTGLTQVLSESAPQGYGTTTYTYGLGRISQQSGSTPEYFLGDALGSVRQMTDQAGTITFGRIYDPYGVVTYTGGTSQTEYGFTGEQYGDSTQLLYLRARYYNPADGRFLTKDPSGAESNLFLYAAGNPINRVDHSGLFSKLEISSSFLWMNEENLLDDEDLYFNQVLNSEEFKTKNIRESGMAAYGTEKWGFLSALLDAQPGDRIEAYSLEFNTWSPSRYKKIGSYVLDSGVKQSGLPRISANGIPVTSVLDDYLRRGSVFINPGSPSFNADTRFYVLYSKNGIKAYLDGSSETDYPDFIVSNVGGSIGSEIAKKIIEPYLVKQLGRIAVDCISPFSFMLSNATDRYGNEYRMYTFSVSHPGSVTAFFYGEGYLSANPRRPISQMYNSTGLISAMRGLSYGPSINAIVGLSGSRSPSGVNAWIRSYGLQVGINFDVSVVDPTGASNPNLAWQWAIDNEAGITGSSAVFRSDLEAHR